MELILRVEIKENQSSTGAVIKPTPAEDVIIQKVHCGEGAVQIRKFS